MKKLFLLLSLIYVLQVNAQTNVYHPFPQTYGDWWLRTQTYGTSSMGPIYDTLYFTTGDTLVNSLTYKKVNYIYKGIGYGPTPPINYIFTGGTYSFAYRNDSLNKKVYILPATSITENLWYNFNLNLGDTLKNFSAVSYLHSIVVVSIDSTLICGNYYKTFSCACTANLGAPSYARETLIEGIGFTSRFLGLRFNGTNCVGQPHAIPYTTAWSINACPNGLAGIKTNHNTQPKIYPNPANNKIIIDATDVTDVKLFDILGKQISSTKTNELDVSNFNDGVYFIQVKTNTGISTQKIIVQH